MLSSRIVESVSRCRRTALVELLFWVRESHHVENPTGDLTRPSVGFRVRPGGLAVYGGGGERAAASRPVAGGPGQQEADRLGGRAPAGAHHLRPARQETKSAAQR